MHTLRIILALAALTLTAAGQAHTSLSTSEPHAGEVLHHSPTRLCLQFPAPVRLIRVELLNSHGDPVELDLHQGNGADTEFEIPVPELGAGEYTVKWVTMGGDTHKMSGDFTFSVAEQAHD